MPVQTRSRLQTTIAFPCRKAKTPGPGKTSHTKEDKLDLGLKRDRLRACREHSRSKSLSDVALSADTRLRKTECSKPVLGSPSKMVVSFRSPQKKEPSSPGLRTPSKSPRKRNHSERFNDENQLPAECSPTKVKKMVDFSEGGLSPKKTPQKTPQKVQSQLVSPFRNISVVGHSNKNSTPKKTPQKLQSTLASPLRGVSVVGIRKPEDECYNNVKRALHTSLPDRILCRQTEIDSIKTFLKDHVQRKKPGSLYMSGAPGTGKTACIKQILQDDKSLTKGVQTVFVNCMLVRQSQGIYNKVLKEVTHDTTTEKMSAKIAARKLQKTFTSKGPTVLLVLDEIDHLDSKGQEVLYTMFEWPSLPKSRLVLIGVANALDLTDRILPRLQSRPKCKPQLLHFAPYTRDQITTILHDRLKETTVDGVAVVDPMAVQMCARKVAAVAGDMRKALDVCRRAVEIVEADVRSKNVLKPTKGSPRKSPQKSPRKNPRSPSKIPKKVGLLQVSSVIGEVYGSRMTSSSNSQSQTFPLQQKLAICTVLMMVKEGKSREVTLGKVHENYCKVCATRRVVPVDQSEFLSLCQLIETRGVLTVKKSKDARQSKISLKLNEKELEFALQDKVLMSAILEAGLPGNKSKNSQKL